jgi:hypothetical protein
MLLAKVTALTRQKFPIKNYCFCKKLSFSQLDGSRKKGRPKSRWLDDVLQDLKILNSRLGGRKNKTEIVGRLLSRRPRLWL